ncbi:DNA mismatch repair protein msh6 [Orbilia ellipsospora]|uniref:DNA mismatch repair protein n=1 Tax=Orbilia ellipsospora TaxID=2528407 RepID=A0AAV9X947_9PEZI
MAPSTAKKPSAAAGNGSSTPSSSIRKNSAQGGTPSSASGPKQRSLFTFFQKVSREDQQAQSSSGKTQGASQDDKMEEEASAATETKDEDSMLPPPLKPSASRSSLKTKSSFSNRAKAGFVTPVASSDPARASSPVNGLDSEVAGEMNSLKLNSSVVRTSKSDINLADASSPLSRGKKKVNYAEPDSDEDDDMVGAGGRRNAKRSSKRQKIVLSDDEDEFVVAAESPDADDGEEDNYGLSDDDLDDFIVEDEDEESDTQKSKKRKRAEKKTTKKAAFASSPPPRSSPPPAIASSTGNSGSASRFRFDPTVSAQASSATSSHVSKNASFNKKPAEKPKPKTKEDEIRYPWLVDIQDKDGNRPGDEDYDPRTLFIPKYAWNKFSPFEKQYWEIKQDLFDTVVFFKKGKFYELYESDATIGHQEFDLKLTDRVNMRMVGVPESSLNMWASQFIAKGYKIARVDQKETALGKEMRENDNKKKDADKIIRRELECVLTGGTLVDETMLQNEMATYCVAIKESVENGVPSYGICFVDTATGCFSLAGFQDDVDATKFETLVAQIRPKELVLEKGCLSTKALRILKTNTDPKTIWTNLKSEREFWDSDQTIRELDASTYFEKDGSTEWPEVLEKARDKPLVVSAFGGLLWYLRQLKIDTDLVSLANFQWYDPIRKSTSLVMDGQTLQNLEIFSNSFDGGAAGTLFNLLNQCITPFGKRTFRQWLCHPLSDARKINARLDAVEAIMADATLLDTFSTQLNRLPDLERMISRIHAGSCKPADFLRVIEGFEQINLTIDEIKQYGGGGDGVIAELIASMPDLDAMLEPWTTAFNRREAKDGKLIPEHGFEQDFDDSQDNIDGIEKELQDMLQGYRNKLKSSALKFCDSGKEIYLVEAPVKVKVPDNWMQMSATKQVKRYYSPEGKAKVRELQEARERHAQIERELLGRFCTRFDDKYTDWFRAVKVISQLDCLISLAKASQGLGEPSCRPQFVDSERSILEFEELRHPCMTNTVGDFIPNDIKLGGKNAKITLLTGANAAGKSTILRMTCIGVIMAQIGCYVPAISCKMTVVDRIMSRLGANDNIFAAQSTFFVELSETKKILSEATPRSLVILDELGRGTSSYDGVAIAQSVLHHVASHIGAIGYFATHYGSLAVEFEDHPEIQPRRMKILVDDDQRNITFLYKLEEGVAEKSFGMYCAAMCGIDKKIIDKAEEAAAMFEHTSRLREGLEKAREGCYVPLGLQSDLAWLMRGEVDMGDLGSMAMETMMNAIKAL